ncbi:hypothetical protein [Agrobacterium radiobacter]|uniref:hypothetical protein n=1 Tax=Agrobacterium radiobacter TaxID=362 RepID=UPI003F85556E
MKVFKFLTGDVFSILDAWVLVWATAAAVNQNYVGSVVITLGGGILSGIATALVKMIERRK